MGSLKYDKLKYNIFIHEYGNVLIQLIFAPLEALCTESNFVRETDFFKCQMDTLIRRYAWDLAIFLISLIH